MSHEPDRPELSRFKAALMKWRQETGDPLLEPDGFRRVAEQERGLRLSSTLVIYGKWALFDTEFDRPKLRPSLQYDSELLRTWLPTANASGKKPPLFLPFHYGELKSLTDYNDEDNEPLTHYTTAS